MPRRPDEFAVEVIDGATADVFRAMTPAERVAFAAAVHRGVRDVLSRYVRHEHPDWSASAGTHEVSRILLVTATDEFVPPTVIES